VFENCVKFNQNKLGKGRKKREMLHESMLKWIRSNLSLGKLRLCIFENPYSMSSERRVK
jgi:hypothetical protein